MTIFMRMLKLSLFCGVAAAAGLPGSASAVYWDGLTSVASSGKKSKTFSLSVYKRCGGKTYRGQRNCPGISIYADPPALGITELDMDLHYDPRRWIFRPDESGFLCAFSSTGGCPPANAQLGTFEVESLGDDTSFLPGLALAGSTVTLTDDNINGVVSLHYLLGQALDAQGEQNFFSFFFEAVIPFADISLVSYYDDPLGSYDFSQAEARCITTIGECASLTPIVGINVTFVPLPQTAALFALGLCALAVSRRRQRWQAV